MRIDYSEPKKSYVTGQAQLRPRKEPIGLITIIAIVTGVITFIGGFGTGWFFSQRAAKKSFQAATEQTSLENSPKPPPPQQPQPKPVSTVSLTDQASSSDTTANSDVVEPPLSFYKTLPSGQKGNVLGSGINTKEDKPKLIQAAIPSNLVQQPEPAKVVNEKAQTLEKPATKSQDSGVFIVQVGSYSLRSEAESLKAKLAGKGYSVSVVESNQGDKGTWFRVRVGKKLAQAAAKELAAKLGKGSIVTPDRE